MPTLWLLSVCAFASMASMRVGDSLVPVLSAEFATSAGRAAQVISAFALAYGLSQLIYGTLGDRYGKVRIIGLATVGCVAGNAAAAFSPTLDWLVVSRMISGATAAGIIPLTMAWIGDTVAYEQRQAVLARLLGATVFGMISGQWLGGVIADTLGWRTAFGALAAIFLLGGATLLASGNEAPAAPAGVRRSFLKGIAQVLALPWARWIMGAAFIEGALAFSALAFIPFHLHGGLGLSLSTAGALVALYGIGGLIYSRWARALVRRLGEAGLAKLGGVCMAAAFATLAVAGSWIWAAPACLVAGFGFYALHNTLQTHATQMAPEARGTAVSLFACSLFFGQSAGILAAAWFVDRYPTAMIFACSAVGLLLLAYGFASLIANRLRMA